MKKYAKEPSVAARMSALLPTWDAEADAPIAELSFGLEPDGGRTACTGLVVVTRTRLLVARNGHITQDLPMEKIGSVRVENGVGCVLLSYLPKDGDEVLFARADRAQARAIHESAKRINRYLREGEAGLQTRTRHAAGRCPKCGRPYPRGMHTCPRCISKSRALLRLAGMARAEWPFLLPATLFFLLVTLTGLYLPYLNRVMVDDYVYAHPTANGFWLGFLGVVLAVLGVNALRLLFSALRGVTLVAAGNRLILRLRDRVFAKIEALTYRDVTQRSTGEMMKLVGGDTARIRTFLINQLPSLIEQTLLLVAIAVLLVWYDLRLALLILLPAPIVALTFRLLWRWMRRLFAKRRELNARAGTVLHDVFSGIRVVKAYGMEAREERRFVEMAAAERDAQVRQERVWALLMPMMSFCMSIGEFLLLYYVGVRMLAGEMTPGEMAQFSAYAGMVYAPLAALMRLPRQLLMMLTSWNKICELMDTPTEEKKTVPVLGTIRGEIEIENVSFAYDEQEVLHGVNLHVRPGEFVGLVGRSGVGKSTLINLIMRMYDVHTGSIRMDGVELSEIPEAELRRQMGVVLQETFLFSGTVWQNLTYAKPTATREEVMEAARAAGAHDFIVALPDGYNTYVGERGHTLSGGERQRIAIARALLHDPRVLILDEATSALDTETEAAVQAALARLCAGRTTIAIAHRLSTLRNATRLVVLDAGRVAEEGTHEELMNKGGLYYGLVMAQREMSRMPNGEGQACDVSGG